MPKSVRQNYRAFHIAPGSAQIVAVYGKGEILRKAFAQLNEEKIVVVLTEGDELNTEKIAFSDELLILNESEILSDFEFKIARIADVLLTPTSILKQVKPKENEEKTDDEKTIQNNSTKQSDF